MEGRVLGSNLGTNRVADHVWLSSISSLQIPKISIDDSYGLRRSLQENLGSQNSAG